MQKLSIDLITRIPTPDFFDLSYLEAGSPQQRHALEVMQSSKILSLLSEFSPVLVGTFPLDLVTDKSDLDILAYAPNLLKFEREAGQALSHLGKLSISRLKYPEQEPALVMNFVHQGMEFEVFAQGTPTQDQRGFLHLVAEWRLLKFAGDEARSRILELKKQGKKTEPAFAEYFELEGDPYLALLPYGETRGPR